MTENSDKTNDIKKTKEILTGLAPVGTMVGGAIAGSPELVATGALAFFGSILSPILRRRSNQYLNSLHESIIELQKEFKEFKPENLSKNERFATAVVKTTQIALRTNQDEKREILKNAVINSVLKDTIEEDLQYVFINSIDVLTPTHINALQEFVNLKQTVDEDRAIMDIIDKYKEFISDLSSQGFLNFHDDKGGSILLEQAPYIPMYSITEKGSKFLEFIKV